VLRARDKDAKPYAVSREECNDCGLCMRIACPALVKRDEEVMILAGVCTGCGVCAQVCSREAIKLQGE
jgi:indolepyruvate ferredoxin oxidoreductase alpha subunit